MQTLQAPPCYIKSSYKLAVEALKKIPLLQPLYNCWEGSFIKLRGSLTHQAWRNGSGMDKTPPGSQNLPLSQRAWKTWMQIQRGCACMSICHHCLAFWGALLIRYSDLASRNSSEYVTTRNRIHNEVCTPFRPWVGISYVPIWIYFKVRKALGEAELSMQFLVLCTLCCLN